MILLKVERTDYIDKLEDISDIEKYRNLDTRYNAFVHMVNEIAYLIKIYTDSDKNYYSYKKMYRNR